MAIPPAMVPFTCTSTGTGPRHLTARNPAGLRRPRARPGHHDEVTAMPERGLIRWALIIAAIVFGALWLLGAIATGFTAPAWVPPAGFLCLAVAVALP